jgi:3-methyladenine DNA glycosylase/8-oxoguanine DNA glycosylase
VSTRDGHPHRSRPGRTPARTAPPAGCVTGLAERQESGAVDVDGLAELADDEATAVIPAVPGLGRRTAGTFLRQGLSRADVLPAGDIGIRRAVRRALGPGGDAQRRGRPPARPGPEPVPVLRRRAPVAVPRPLLTAAIRKARQSWSPSRSVSGVFPRSTVLAKSVVRLTGAHVALSS